MAYLSPPAWYIDSGTGIGSISDFGTSNNTAGATLSPAFASTFTVPAGALIVVAVLEATATTPGTLSDGVNTYTTGPSQLMNGGAGILQIFYCANCSAVTGGTLTYTKNTSGHNTSLSAFYVTGIATSSPLDTAFTASTPTTTATITLTSGTPSAQGLFVMAIAGFIGSPQNWSGAPTPWTNPPIATTATGAEIMGGSIIYEGTAPLSWPAISWTGAGNGGAIFVGFKSAVQPGTGYWAIPPWLPTHSYAPGAVTRQHAPTSQANDRVFAAIQSAAQNSGSTEPTWVITKGGKTTDGSVTWIEITGQPGVNGDISAANCPQWTVSSTPSQGLIIYEPTSASLQVCTTSGAGGTGAKPTFSATAGVTTADASATWTSLGLASGFGTWAAPFSRSALAVGAGGWVPNGAFTYYADNHNEINVGGVAFAPPSGGVAGPFGYAISIDHTAALPPAASAVKAGATITTINTAAISINTNNGAPIYVNGLTFKSTTGNQATASTVSIGIGGSNANGSNLTICENCTFALPSYGTNSGGTNGFVIGNSTNAADVLLANCSFSYGSVSWAILPWAVRFRWKNTTAGAIAAGSPFIPTNLIFAGNAIHGGMTDLSGLDLSALGSGKTILAVSNGGPMEFYARNCKLNAAVTQTNLPTNGQPGSKASFINCDSGATTYTHSYFSYEGTLTAETQLYRAGGASNGVQPIGWNLTTNADAFWVNPLDSFPIAIWNTTLGTNRTVTISGISIATALPNNDDIWPEIEYLGSGSSPLASLAPATKANLLATNAAWATDAGSDWTGGAAAYQTAHAYGAGAGVVIKAGNSTPQQTWFVFSHAGTGTSGGSTTIFNSQSDGAQVTDNSGANQIVWQAHMRFKMTATLSVANWGAQPGLVGDIAATIKVAKPSSTFYIDPVLVLG